jgi:membrane protease YdiL (CAAX protease family)
VKARLIGWCLFVASLSTLSFVDRFSGNHPAKNVAYDYATSANAAIFYIVLLGLAMLATYGLDRRAFLGLRRPASWPRAAGISALVVLAVMIVSGLVAQFANAPQEQGLVPTYWDSHRATQFAAYAAIVAGLGPIVEELMFRGVGYGLLERYGRGVAVIVVGLAFALIHGLVEGFPILATFGIGLTYLRAKTGSIYPCIILHAAFNGAALALGVAR